MRIIAFAASLLPLCRLSMAEKAVGRPKEWRPGRGAKVSPFIHTHEVAGRVRPTRHSELAMLPGASSRLGYSLPRVYR